jgi:Xaa-Pro aminopeptidase
MQAEAVQQVGEPIGEFGNDFQIGALGSSPRRRPAEAGEMAILDLTVVVRGYASDMCRSFVVGGAPSTRQTKALQRIREVHTLLEELIVPGISCPELYRRANKMLDGYEGWSFKHHAGHGIGLSNHEAPRINPHWNDTLQIGDVIALEPGLYGADLRAGLRIEEVYHLSATGLKKLTTFPTELACSNRL